MKEVFYKSGFSSKPHNAAIDYVRKMIELGYDSSMIKEELSKKSWSTRDIEKVMKEATVLESKYALRLLKSFIILGIIGTVIFITWVSAATSAMFSVVFISFLPIILTLATIYLTIEYFGKKFLAFSILVPLCWVGLLYVLSVNGSTTFQNVEMSNILILNLLISVVFVIVVTAISKNVK
jgi:hypothetical protein